MSDALRSLSSAPFVLIAGRLANHKRLNILTPKIRATINAQTFSTLVFLCTTDQMNQIAIAMMYRISAIIVTSISPYLDVRAVQSTIRRRLDAVLHIQVVGINK